MAFPTSPSNNQVHKEGNRAWVYDSALGVWDQVADNDAEADNIAGTLGNQITFPSGMPIKIQSKTYTGTSSAPISPSSSNLQFQTIGGVLDIDTGQPYNASSKFLMRAYIHHSLTSSGTLVLRFFDGDTAITAALGDADGSATRVSFGPAHWSTGPGSYPVYNSCMEFLYSPNSAVGMSLSVRGCDTGSYVHYYNRSNNASTAAWQARPISTFTVTEIAG